MVAEYNLFNIVRSDGSRAPSHVTIHAVPTDTLQ